MHGQQHTHLIPLKHRPHEHLVVLVAGTGADAVETVLPVAKLIRSISRLIWSANAGVHVPLVMDVCIRDVSIEIYSFFHFSNAVRYSSFELYERRIGMESSIPEVGSGNITGSCTGFTVRHGSTFAKHPVQHDNNCRHRIERPRDEDGGMVDDPRKVSTIVLHYALPAQD